LFEPTIEQIVPGSAAWFLRGGVSFGETHVGVSSLKDWTNFNYPLDCYYEALSTEGWPFLVCEVRGSRLLNAPHVDFLKGYLRCMFRCGTNRMKESGTSLVVVAFGCLHQDLINSI
jgi:hypothetical protein